MQNFETDVAIIGGGLGAVAAARALLARGLKVTMTDEFLWIGGQATSQAMCVPDEYHDPIFEGGGSTRRYFEFREQLRNYYKSHYQLSKLGSAQIHFSPSGGPKPVSAEPTVALKAIMDDFLPAIEDGRLRILPQYVAESAEREENTIRAVVCHHTEKPEKKVTIRARFFISGDETGELYPLLGIGFRMGAESRDEFDEPHAPVKADSDSLQSFTYCFAMEYIPGGSFTIAKPADYERWKSQHGHSFFVAAPGSRQDEPAYMFRIRTGRGGIRIKPGFYYRTMVDKELFNDSRLTGSRTIFNVDGNDYNYGNFVGKPEDEKKRILNEARQLSLAYMYWLQTEAPRDDGNGLGYPELRPMPEITGADYGLAMAPYIREGRRLKACQTITEQDISTAFQTGSRARFFSDSVGVGCFIIDIHQRVGAGSVSQMTRPYQISLGSLVCPELTNFAVAGKGIGVTQITNGAYRLHAVEWNIGEAAGELAAFCLERKSKHPRLSGRDLFDFQRRLLREGFTLYWYEDLPINHPGFEAVQILSLKGIWPGNPRHLRFNPNYSVVREAGLFNYIMDRLAAAGTPIDAFRERQERSVCTRLYDVAHRLMCHLDEVGWPEFVFSEESPILKDPDAKIFNDYIPEPMDDSALPGQPAKVGATSR